MPEGEAGLQGSGNDTIGQGKTGRNRPVFRCGEGGKTSLKQRNQNPYFGSQEASCYSFSKKITSYHRKTPETEEDRVYN